MKSMAGRPAAGILIMMFAFDLLFFSFGGCGNDSGRTRLGFAPVGGHYTGSGSFVEIAWESAPRLNLAWKADFTRQTESTFVGTVISTFTDPKTTVSGESMQWGIKGTVTWSRCVTIMETSMVIPKSPGWIYGDQQFLKSFEECTVSVKGDTIFYSGPGPELETFVLIKAQ